jgi:hypothetical protein
VPDDGKETRGLVPGAVDVVCRAGRELLAAADAAEREHLRRMPALERTGDMPAGGMRPAGMETRTERGGGEP